MAEQVRVLVCEDDPQQLRLLNMELQRLGYKVVGTAQDGEETVAQAVALKPDIILMDILMSKIDGIEATRRIMAQAPTAVVMLTALIDQAKVEAAIEAGASGYLAKRVDNPQLYRTLLMAQRRFEEFRQVQQEAQTLQAALSARKVIEQAKGVIMQHINIEAEAFRRLKRLSNDKSIPLHEAARRILAGAEPVPDE